MTVKFIPGNPPEYQLLSTDITSGSYVTGSGDKVSYIGAMAFTTDDGNFYRVIALKTLAKLPQQVSLLPELALNTSNLTLVLTGSKASAPILDNSTRVGLYVNSGSTVRVGFEQPDLTTGSSSGSGASSSDFKKGYPLTAGSLTWFNIGRGVSRSLFFQSGSSTNTVQIIQM
jgi:hypothetical protein